MIVTAGATNRSVYFYITGDASHASPGNPITGLLFSDIETGGSASYARQGAARVDLTLITLASASAAHADGGFILVDDTNMPGVYRCDYPDAAFVTGVDQITCDLLVAAAKNAHVAPVIVDITDVNLRDAVRAGLTALPNAVVDAAGGLPISDAGGLDFDAILAAVITNAAGADIAADIIAMKAETVSILEDTGTTIDTKLDDIQGATFATATDSLEALRNRGDAAWTGSATLSDSGTAQAGSASTITLRAGAPAVDNVLEGHLVFISSGTGVGQSKAIAENGYNGTTKVATIIGAWEVNPDATSVYEVTPDAITEFTAAPTAAANADAVWDENMAGHTAAGTAGEQLKNDIDAILADTGDMQPKIGAPAGASMSADIAAMKVDTAATLVDTAVIGAAGAGLTDLGGMSTGMKAEVNVEIDGALDTAIPGAPTADSMNQRVRSMDLLTEAAGAGDLAAVLVDSGTSIPALIAALENISVANVNAQVLDVMRTDVFGEPGQEAPGVSISMGKKIDYLYKAWRNLSTETSTDYKLFNDDGTTVAQKAPISDDTTTASKGEVVTGP